MSAPSVLRVGDTVLHRAGFGTQPAKAAKVLRIELCDEHPKYGIDVSAASWADRKRIVVDLDNGHWAYGEQIDPIQDGELVATGEPA